MPERVRQHLNRLPAAHLSTNRRQAQEWERDALAQMRSGEVGVAITAYGQHRRVTTGPSADVVRGRLVEDWTAGSPEEVLDTACGLYLNDPSAWT